MTGLEDFISSEFAPLGRMYCNPPELLFEKMIEKMKTLRPNLQVLFITGDFIGHHTNNKRGEPYDNKRYDRLMGMH